jgi:hypothetical protein
MSTIKSKNKIQIKSKSKSESKSKRESKWLPARLVGVEASDGVESAVGAGIRVLCGGTTLVPGQRENGEVTRGWTSDQLSNSCTNGGTVITQRACVAKNEINMCLQFF